ncbi:hypothetical protein ES703_22975 [subsurface metagenome]
MTENTEFNREKASFFSIVCYGIHSKLNSWIKNEFGKCIKQKPIAFYEYFLTTPITKQQSIDGLKAYAPYLFRILNEREWIPEMGSMKSSANAWEDIKMVNSYFDSLKKFWALDGKGMAMADVHKMPVLSELVGEWKKLDTPDIVSDNILITKSELEILLNQALAGAKINFKEWLPFIQEYSLVVLPWLRCPSKENFNIYACSISSKYLFFGEVMIVYPKNKQEKSEQKEKDPVNERLEKFKRELKRVVEELYLPVLTLFENHWEETVLRDELKDAKKALENNEANNSIVCKSVFHSDDLEKSDKPLELLFYDIWNSRAKILNEPVTKVTLQQVSDSLPFGKYIIASPGLLNEFPEKIFPYFLEYSLQIHLASVFAFTKSSM